MRTNTHTHIIYIYTYTDIIICIATHKNTQSLLGHSTDVFSCKKHLCVELHEGQDYPILGFEILSDLMKILMIIPIPQSSLLYKTLRSCASLTSSGLFTGTLMSRGGRSASLSPSPKSRSHGRCYSPRRFSSRHVPAAAEELAAHSQARMMMMMVVVVPYLDLIILKVD